MLGLRPGQTVLEIGSGTGRGLTDLAAGVGATGRVIGLDISAGMQAVAHRRMVRAGLCGRVCLLQGDAAQLPVPDGVVDAVLMCFTLELFAADEIPVVLGECRRALKPGGRLAVVSMSEGRGFMPGLYAWAHRVWPSVVDCRPIRADEHARDAGFMIVNTEHLSIMGLSVQVVMGGA